MAYLEIVDGPNRGTVLDIAEVLTIGRSPDNVLCLPDSRASRHHARIEPHGEGHLLVDLGSANGTFVNRQPLPASDPHTLQTGDEIVIGSTWLVYRSGSQSTGSGKRHVLSDSHGTEQGSSLSILVTGEEAASPAVNMTLDASLSMMEVLPDEKGTEKGLEEAIERLQAMVKVSSDLGAVVGKQAVLEKIMDSIFDIFPHADRAFIMLREGGDGEMVPVVGHNRNARAGAQEEFAISRTIIETVIEKRQSLLSSDAQQDDRFGMQQSIVELSIRSMMCAPFLWKDEILGVINVDTMSGMHAFDSDDLAMLTGIAAQAAIAIKNADLYASVQKESELRAQMSRYVSPDVAEGIINKSIPFNLGGETKHGTVFFCDIVGFTAMSEKMTAVEVIDKLNRYFRITTEVVSRNRGTLHKFGGDMIMAFWNVMFPDDRPELKAIRTSLEMQAAVWAFDLDLEREGQSPIYLGIGCNTGDFAGGNIGGEKIEYTVIGDNVNLGQRVEALAGRWQVFVSEATFAPVREQCSAVELPAVSVKGKSMPIKVFSIRGVQVEDNRMELVLPVILRGPEKSHIGRGLLVEASGWNAAIELRLHTDATIQDGAPVEMELDLPELADEYVLRGVADDVITASHDGDAIYSQVQLSAIQAEAPTLSLLRPGALRTSKRSWDEMKRR